VRTGSAAAAVIFVFDDAFDALEHPASTAATAARANQTTIGLHRSHCTPTTTLMQAAKLAGRGTDAARHGEGRSQPSHKKYAVGNPIEYSDGVGRFG
jgi:hypothetical protein